MPCEVDGVTINQEWCQTVHLTHATHVEYGKAKLEERLFQTVLIGLGICQNFHQLSSLLFFQKFLANLFIYDRTLCVSQYKSCINIFENFKANILSSGTASIHVAVCWICLNIKLDCAISCNNFKLAKLVPCSSYKWLWSQEPVSARAHNSHFLTNDGYDKRDIIKCIICDTRFFSAVAFMLHHVQREKCDRKILRNQKYQYQQHILYSIKCLKSEIDLNVINV